MNASPWLNSRTSPAICPKCNAPALHRSHTQSRLEERRKKMTGRRPFRCHVCGTRGWFEETSLRYPTSAEKPLAPGIAGKDLPVPDIRLDEGTVSTAFHLHGKIEAANGALPRPTQASNGSTSAARNREDDAAPPPAADVTGLPPVGWSVMGMDISAMEGEERPPEDPSKDTGAVRNRGRGMADDENGRTELAEERGGLPGFDEQSGRPISVKVSRAFHHHARNKSMACPACREFTLFRSRARSFGETLRKKFTNSRPFRCHRCGWRGWMTK